MRWRQSLAVACAASLLAAACSGAGGAGNGGDPTTTVTTSEGSSPGGSVTTQVPATTTTLPPVPEPPVGPVAAACEGVPISPGQQWQSVVDENPAGTVFCVAAGGHYGQSVVPRDGDTFIGAVGAFMDGQRQVAYAFSGGARDVTISNLEIKGYVPPFHGRNGSATQGFSHGAITSSGDDERQTGEGEGWVVEHNEIHGNLAGVLVGDRSVVRFNYIHHNDQIGLKVYWVDTEALVEGNLITDNNFGDEYDAGWEAGGTKFAWTLNLVVRENRVIDNHGPGLWTDIDNVDTLYENNLVEGNEGPGIFHEISYDAVIRHNTVIDNGHEGSQWLWEAGILIAASSNVEVYGNRVEGNENAITGVQQNRGDGELGPRLLTNLWVHDNTIVDSGIVGVARDNGDDAVFTARDNRFENNTYVSVSGRQFAWDNRFLTRDEWVSAGHDLDGAWL